MNFLVFTLERVSLYSPEIILEYEMYLSLVPDGGAGGKTGGQDHQNLSSGGVYAKLINSVRVGINISFNVFL